MIIKSLKLSGFRSYDKREFVFDDKLNIIVGKNAVGKTNLLEAIYFFCIGKSFKTAKEKEVINWNTDLSKIEIVVERKFRTVKLEMFFSKNSKKTIKINGIPIKKTGEILGELNGIFFSPDELRLIKESPDERRKFMDIDISQTNKTYFYLIQRYEKILASRNKLLKTTNEYKNLKDTIDIWDRQLADVAKKIILERRKFVEELSPLASLACEYMTEGREKIKLQYVGMEGETAEEIESNILKKLEKNIERDYRLGYTSVGPHRDEIDVYINDIEVKTFGSQGQQRTAALAMKLAELEIIERKAGEKPILLLDDVFSELDKGRREKLLKFTSKAQTFITCTDFEDNKLNHKRIEIRKEN